MVPRVDISGDTVRYGRIINRGCHSIRRVIVQAAWSLVRCCAEFPTRPIGKRCAEFPTRPIGKRCAEFPTRPIGKRCEDPVS
nr:IS110 family transposase [Leptospira sp. severe_002]